MGGGGDNARALCFMRCMGLLRVPPAKLVSFLWLMLLSDSIIVDAGTGFKSLPDENSTEDGVFITCCRCRSRTNSRSAAMDEGSMGADSSPAICNNRCISASSAVPTAFRAAVVVILLLTCVLCSVPFSSLTRFLGVLGRSVRGCRSCPPHGTALYNSTHFNALC